MLKPNRGLATIELANCNKPKKWLLFLIIENALLATYPDAFAACVMNTIVPVPATVANWPSGKCVCLWSCRLGFDSQSGKTNDFKTGVHSFPP